MATLQRSPRTLALLGIPLAAMWVMGLVVSALTPTLLARHPLLLVALEPRNRNLILAANRVDPLPFVAFATVRRFISDPLYFLLGKLYGEAAVRWAEKQMGQGGSLVRAVEQLFRRAGGAMVFLFPGALVCVLAGATGMRTRRFMVLNLSGTLAIVVALRLFAHTIEEPVRAIQEFNDRNFRWLTVVTVALVVVWLVVRRRRAAAAGHDLASMEQETAGEDPPR